MQLELGNYYLDVIDIKDFKKYMEENDRYFSANAFKAYLKAVDIPPKFFKEQPDSTQRELIDNRDLFVRQNKKYFDKVIVVARLKIDMTIMNACRMTESEAKERYEQLKPIDQMTDKFEHRSFIKDGYVSYIFAKNNEIRKSGDNQVVAVDFPIMLNKKPVLHEALYTLPNETFATPIEHIHYLTAEEVEIGADYTNIKDAIEDKISFVDKTLPERKNEKVLREPEVVSLALVEGGVIPGSYAEKLSIHIKENTKGELTTASLESFVLDFDETLRSYKQVTNLRSIDGSKILEILESENFKEVVEEMEKIKEEI